MFREDWDDTSKLDWMITDKESEELCWAKQKNTEEKLSLSFSKSDFTFTHHLVYRAYPSKVETKPISFPEVVNL